MVWPFGCRLLFLALLDLLVLMLSRELKDTFEEGFDVIVNFGIMFLNSWRQFTCLLSGRTI